MKVYRILHVPTGHYFCPSREVKVKLVDGAEWQATGCYVKSNLSKTGRTYAKRPSFTFLGNGYYTHLITSVKQLNTNDRKSCVMPVLPSEWQIEVV